MRYLRMLTNSVVGGLLAAAYLTILVLQLNPQIPPVQALRVAAVLALFYGALLTMAFYGLIVLRQLVAADGLSPGWISLRLLPWLTATAAGGAAALMWMNLRLMRSALSPEAAEGMDAGAVATTTSALAILAVAVVQYSLGRRGRRLVMVLFAAATVVSLSMPVVLRVPGAERPLGAYRLDLSGWMAAARPATAGRVVMLLLDGASLDYISPAAADGRLPNFGRLIDAGATLHLATVHPTQPGPVWATFATGKYPWKHGVRAAAAYDFGSDVSVELLPDLCYAHALVRLGFVRTTPHTSAALGARPLWSILSGLGVSVGVVGLPLTYPAQPVLGFLVSDRWDPTGAASLESQADSSTYPADVGPFVRGLLDDSAQDEGAARSGAALDRAAPREAGALHLPDRASAKAGRQLQQRFNPRLLAVRYQTLDTVGHQFLRYAMPRAFGNVTEDERRRFGRVLDQYYGLIDDEVGAAIERLEPDDLLLVVSGFGMDPVTLGKRILATVLRDADVSGSHERAPDGFLMAYGSAIEAGHYTRGAIVDVAPTILYFLGLPVGRDMDGRIRVDLFRSIFTADRPVTFIPSYER